MLLEKSVDICLPISALKPFIKPPSENPIAASADVPIANSPATPAPTIPSLTIFSIMDLICYLIQLEHRMS